MKEKCLIFQCLVQSTLIWSMKKNPSMKKTALPTARKIVVIPSQLIVCVRPTVRAFVLLKTATVKVCVHVHVRSR